LQTSTHHRETRRIGIRRSWLHNFRRDMAFKNT
jgi:hypothetical protein